MIHVLPVKGVFLTYCYFLIDDETKHGFLFDVGAQGKKFADIIKQNGWTIEKIFLTHAHFDHTGGLDELRQHLDIPVYAHNNAQKLLESPELNLSRYCCEDILIDDVRFFEGNEVFSLSANPMFKVQAIYTPGHTIDSVTYYCENEAAAFVGDTIFKGQPGTDQYPTANRKDLIRSIRTILSLPDNTTLCSGHSEPTTVKLERLNYQM